MTAPHLLEVTSLTKSFGEVTVANSVSLALERGELVGIIGPNGAGKSSVFNLIAGTLRPDSGRVFLEGRDVTALNAADRVKAGIFRAFQIPQAFPHMSVYENILAAASFSANRSVQDAEEQAVTAMRRAGQFVYSHF